MDRRSRTSTPRETVRAALFMTPWFPSLTLAFFFFFFQAEDGIRDSSVTGVQTWLFRSFTEVEPLAIEVDVAGGSTSVNGAADEPDAHAAVADKVLPGEHAIQNPREFEQCVIHLVGGGDRKSVV